MKDPRPFDGWYVVMAAHVLLALIFGAVYSFGAFFSQVQTNFDVGRFSTASIFSLTALLYYAMGVVSGSLIDRFSTRIVVGCGIVFLALGFFFSSLSSDSLQWFLASFCLLVGIGVGLVYVPTVTAVQRWFVKNRSKASGLALAGTGLGTFIGPLAAGVLMEYVSWQSTMRIFAVSIAALGIGAALLLRGRPDEVGQFPDGEQTTSALPQATALDGMMLSQAVSGQRFWWYFAAILLGSVGLFLAIVHISPYAQQSGLSVTQSNLLIGLIGAGNVAGRLFLGGMGDRLGPERLLFSLTIVLALLHGLWFDAESFISLAFFATLFGMANGGCISLYPSVASQWFGLRNLGAILGALYIAVGIAAIAGGSLAGGLFDLYQNYNLSIILGGSCALLSAGCLVVAGRQPVQKALPVQSAV